MLTILWNQTKYVPKGIDTSGSLEVNESVKRNNNRILKDDQEIMEFIQVWVLNQSKNNGKGI